MLINYKMLKRDTVHGLKNCCCSCSVGSVLFDSLRPRGHQASLSFTNSWSLLKLMSIELVTPSNYLVLSCPLLFLPSIFPSIRVFLRCQLFTSRWPQYWSFSISPSNEYSGLSSFRMDWMDIPAVQGTLKSHLQYHSSEASVLQCSACFYSPALTSIHDHWKNQ